MSIAYLLVRLGITANYYGHRYLVSAIEQVIEDDSNILLITKKLYPFIAEKYDTSASCVERSIRQAITICWERGNRPLLEEIAARPLAKKPRNAEFISLVSMYIRNSDQVMA